jgi:oligopeptide/dipeptide ABC transporter ATP-binding protein
MKRSGPLVEKSPAEASRPGGTESVPPAWERASESGGRRETLLSVNNLTVAFRTDDGCFRAVEDVSFDMRQGEKLGLVGESGCGKSVTALTLMRLLPAPPASIEGGQVLFQGRDVVALPEQEMRRLRGDRIAMIFQEPMTALNPLHRVGDQVAEVLRLHRGYGKREAMREAVALLEKVQIPEARRRAKDYPHQLSGGMRQRIVIAMALACRPDLLIADEPTTALDVTVQAQILDLLEQLTAENGSSVLMITHDMGIVAQLCDRVLIMYAGQIVETALVGELFAQPLHPYTQGLLRSLPRIGPSAGHERLFSIPGTVPDPQHFPVGCRFHPRCEHATDQCALQMPELERSGETRAVRCWHWERIEKSAAVSLLD